uniref:PNPLA domain-containing protein n=1 Tax=Amphora coffeiformis TaxID=265554 RepID=A0A7S3L689_9STRA
MTSRTTPILSSLWLDKYSSELLEPSNLIVARQVMDSAAQLLMEHLPALREMGREAMELIFVPQTVARQLMLLLALETGMVTMGQLQSIVAHLVATLSPRQRRIRALLKAQSVATSQDDWMDLAEQIDHLQGNDMWRTDPNCQLYEQARITARIDEYVHLMRRRDIFELMFVLRGSIGRNKFGLLHEGLFSKALAGSKVLVETYHNVVCAALDFVCDASVAETDDLPIPTDARLAFFNETRHAYGRTALLLSGGAALGFYHVGVVRALITNRLLPRVIGGASAGSIMCAMLGTRTDEECMNDLFCVNGTDAPGHTGKLALNFFRPYQDKQQQPSRRSPDKEAFPYASLGTFGKVYSNTAGAFRDLKRTIQGLVPIPLRRVSAIMYNVLTGNRRAQDIFLNDTEHFRNCMRINCGNFTFQEAFDRTGRILNIVVTPQNNSDPPRLLNYLTAPHVLVWSAAVASSSLPGVFEANRLVVKEADGWERYESAGDDQAFSDGSMEQDLPMQQLSEMFNINHFVISQANPHAVMFASYNQKRSVWSGGVSAVLSPLMTFLKDQIRGWLANLVQCVGARRIAPLFETNRMIPVQFFTQEYEGRPSDISLCPWASHRSLLSALMHIIYNPSDEEFLQWMNAGERETWKHIPAIKSHIAEEMTLDRCVQRLRQRMIVESWEKAGGIETTGRVPSFFTSPSLTNLGGLNILDQPTLEGLRVEKASTFKDEHKEDPSKTLIVPNVDSNSGWGGLGLKGNQSSGNLYRATNDAPEHIVKDRKRSNTSGQSAGERSDAKPSTSPSKNVDCDSKAVRQAYVKTSMASFYYRKSHGSTGNLISQNVDADTGASKPHHQRRKSKSHADLAKSLAAAAASSV